MLLGFAEEKQIVRINLFEEYVEDSVSVGTCTHLSYSLNANKYDMLKTLKCNKKSCFLSFVEGDLWAYVAECLVTLFSSGLHVSVQDIQFQIKLLIGKYQ